jgi:hypothetical protein
MSDDPIGEAARAAKRRHKVPPGTACPFCGEQDPACLVEVDKTILEEHHIAGVANLPDLTVWLCPTCHRKLHVDMLDGDVELSHPPRRVLLVVVAVVLGACVALMRKLADTFEWLVGLLWLFIGSLDGEYPGWRDLHEATM